ncbi:hypothetical protein BJ322DRAFT_1040813 [Thelephora terrestris]|uniref:Uncharacterized protein n=1 Tax=Thelephora terrestris TaxID=56493 RepID=A0A9P6HNK3_9AGAM|nr:hypothetical protein BJ322DRAFT_1040813 [Thelephora terrestris]
MASQNVHVLVKSSNLLGQERTRKMIRLTPAGTQPRCDIEQPVTTSASAWVLSGLPANNASSIRQRFAQGVFEVLWAGRNRFERGASGSFLTMMWPIGIFRCGLWLDQIQGVVKGTGCRSSPIHHWGEYAHQETKCMNTGNRNHVGEQYDPRPE